MAGMLTVFVSPRQTIVEPKDPITLSLAPTTTSIAAEFRWKVSGGTYGASVAGTTTTTYVVPANTWSRDQVIVWQGRYQETGGTWSDWYTFSVDTSGWVMFRASNANTDIPFGPIGSAGAWEGRIETRDTTGTKWSNFVGQSFTIHPSRSLVKDANGRWKGVPILRHNGTTFVATAQTN